MNAILFTLTGCFLITQIEIGYQYCTYLSDYVFKITPYLRWIVRYELYWGFHITCIKWLTNRILKQVIWNLYTKVVLFVNYITKFLSFLPMVIVILTKTFCIFLKCTEWLRYHTKICRMFDFYDNSCEPVSISLMINNIINVYKEDMFLGRSTHTTRNVSCNR